MKNREDVARARLSDEGLEQALNAFLVDFKPPDAPPFAVKIIRSVSFPGPAGSMGAFAAAATWMSDARAFGEQFERTMLRFKLLAILKSICQQRIEAQKQMDSLIAA